MEKMIRELTMEDMSKVSGGSIERTTARPFLLRSRAGSALTETVIARIPKGAVVVVIGRSTQYPSWYYVSYNGRKGYVEGTCLT